MLSRHGSDPGTGSDVCVPLSHLASLSCLMSVVTQIPSDMEHLVSKLENYLVSLITQTFSPRGHEEVRMFRRPVTSGSLRAGDRDYDWESRPIDMKTQTRRQKQWRTGLMVTSSEDPDSDSEYSSTEQPEIIRDDREKRFIKVRGSQGESETDAEEDDTASTSNIVKRRKRTVRRRKRTIPMKDELIFGMDVTL